MDTVQLLTRQNSSSESLQASNQSDSSHHLDSHHTHQVYPTTTRFNRLQSDHPSIPRPRQYGRLPKFCEDRLSLKSALVILLIFSIITITIHKYGIPLDWSKSDYLEHLNSFGSSSQSSFTNTTSKKKLTERKFLVRDWSTGLGWNNMRYIIEHALLLADYLDRELVLPSFVYLTGCEFTDEICANGTSFFVQDVPINLTTIPKHDRWKYPEPANSTNNVLKPVLAGGKKGWLMRLDSMLDVPYLNRVWNRTLSFEDYLELITSSNAPPRLSKYGREDGAWSERDNGNLSYRKIPNTFFRTRGKTMVNRLPAPIEPLIRNGKEIWGQATSSSTRVPPWVLDQCQATLKKVADSKRKKKPSTRATLINPQPLFNRGLHIFPSWDDHLIEGDQLKGKLAIRDHNLLERCLASDGYRTAYGYGFDTILTKAPHDRVKYFRKLDSMVGIWDGLHSYNENILHLEGELHSDSYAAAMLWPKLEDREYFEKLVRTTMRAPEVYDRVAARLETRMRERCQGRSWRAGHMRRGDFVELGWNFKNISTQFERIQVNLNASVALLQDEPDLLIPAHKAYGTSQDPPILDDPIYIATNARHADEIEFLGKQNVVLLNDLLDDNDRAELGSRASYTDTLAIVEQSLMMRSAFFYGDGHSSVGGWILNMRVFYGIDEKLTPIEFFKHPGDGL